MHGVQLSHQCTLAASTRLQGHTPHLLCGVLSCHLSLQRSSHPSLQLRLVKQQRRQGRLLPLLRCLHRRSSHLSSRAGRLLLASRRRRQQGAAGSGRLGGIAALLAALRWLGVEGRLDPQAHPIAGLDVISEVDLAPKKQQEGMAATLGGVVCEQGTAATGSQQSSGVLLLHASGLSSANRCCRERPQAALLSHPDPLVATLCIRSERCQVVFRGGARGVGAQDAAGRGGWVAQRMVGPWAARPVDSKAVGQQSSRACSRWLRQWQPKCSAQAS